MRKFFYIMLMYFFLSCEFQTDYQIIYNFENYIPEAFHYAYLYNNSDDDVYYDQASYPLIEVFENGKRINVRMVHHSYGRLDAIGGSTILKKDEAIRFYMGSFDPSYRYRIRFDLYKDRDLKQKLDKPNLLSPKFTYDEDGYIVY